MPLHKGKFALETCSREGYHYFEEGVHFLQEDPPSHTVFMVRCTKSRNNLAIVCCAWEWNPGLLTYCLMVSCTCSTCGRNSSHIP